MGPLAEAPLQMVQSIDAPIPFAFIIKDPAKIMSQASPSGPSSFERRGGVSRRPLRKRSAAPKRFADPEPKV
jgi:hypothetical protein